VNASCLCADVVSTVLATGELVLPAAEFLMPLQPQWWDCRPNHLSMMGAVCVLGACSLVSIGGVCRVWWLCVCRGAHRGTRETAQISLEPHLGLPVETM
jgi:hypothetical protein